MTRLRAHFDGRVLVPEEPVDLPVGKSIEFVVREIAGASPSNDVGFDINPETGLPVFRVPKGSRIVTAEEIREAQDED